MPPAAKLRRNGQPQACEACRKTKVRCNHGTPQCSRCVSRSLECVYHPAPMTKYRDPLQSPPLSTRRSTVNKAHHAPRSPLSAPVDQHQTTGPSSGASVSGPSSFTPHGITSQPAKRTTLFQREGALYGTTRFTAVFSENHASFRSAIDVIAEGGAAAPSSTEHADHTPDVTSAHLELAIDALMKLPTFHTCQSLIEGLRYEIDVWQSTVMITRCLDQIWREYGAALGDGRSRESVSQMARDIFENGKQPFPDQDYGRKDAEHCVNWFAGPRLRWEMIGIVMGWAGMSFKHKQEYDPVFNLPEMCGRNRQTAAEAMRVGAMACLKLCSDLYLINDLTVTLSKNTGKLHSVIISDESEQLLPHWGTVGSAFISAGLHRLPNISEVTPLYQFRSTISSSLFYLDKWESLFFGRPPMMNSRYCNCPAPLDLDEEDVYNGYERMQVAKSKLDSNGWNTDGKIYPTTWIRALILLAPIREEILDLSLGINVRFSKAQIDALLVELDRVVNTYPAYLHYIKPEDHTASSFAEENSRKIFFTSRIQLDVLQTKFLLQRLLVSRGLSDGQDLFNLAQELMAVVLGFWTNRVQFHVWNYSFDWILMCYGLPCAGILCLELLRASNLAPPMPASTAIPSPKPVQLSRSEVFQTLTIFLTFLDWVRPTDNNVQLFAKFKKVVKRIMDTAMDAPRPGQVGPAQTVHEPPAALESIAAEVQYQDPLLNPDLGMDVLTEYDPALLAMDDLDWLNTVDWTQGDWLEFSTQNFVP